MKLSHLFSNKLCIVHSMLLFLLYPCSLTCGSNGDFIYRLENPDFSLKKRILISLKQVIKNKSCKRIWIGYLVKTDKAPSIFPLSKYATENQPTIKELITGEYNKNNNQVDLKKNVLQQAALLSMNKLEDKKTVSHNSKDKYALSNSNFLEHVILMDYNLETGRPQIYRISAIPFDQSHNFEGRELFWLGKVSQKQSIDWLRYLFPHANFLKLQRQILSTTATHSPNSKLLKFYTYIIRGKYNCKLKEDCIFLLGLQNNHYCNKLLSQIIVYEKSNDLKSKALLALSQSNSKQALDILTSIALDKKKLKLKKQAIFCLGQMDVEQTLPILRLIIDNEKDNKIKEFTLFIISQMSSQKALLVLQDIVKNHSDEKIQQKALYWLDKISNQNALKYLQDISDKI